MDRPFSPIEVMQKAFPGLGPNEAARIVQNGTLMTVSENTVLCHEGKYETTFYLILQGSALVTKVINETETRILKHLSAGDFFGEMAIIHNAPRAATVSTLTPTTVLALEKEAFSDILETSSSISLAMVREVSSRLRENDEMAIEELFFAKNIKTGISVAHARGVAMLSGAERGLPIYEYKPNEIKLGICGYGHADKKQMSKMVELHIRGCKIEQDDTADAVAIALYHLQCNKIR